MPGLGIWSSVLDRINSFMWSKDWKIKSIVKKIESFPSIFFKDRQDRRAKIDGSIKRGKHLKHTKNTFFLDQIARILWSKDQKIYLITVDLFKRSTRAIRTRSILLKERKQRKMKDWMIQRSNSQPCVELIYKNR